MAVATVWRPRLTLAPNGELALRCPFDERDAAKRIPGWRWDKATKTWRYPARPETLVKLKLAFPGLQVANEVIEAVERVQRVEESVSAMKEDRSPVPIVPMPLREGVRPYWHQITAFNIVATLFGYEQKEVVPSVPAMGKGAALLMEQGTG